MQRTGLKRQEKNEKYYTKPEVVNKCLEEFKKLNIDKTTDVVIEPSAGNGSFTSRLVEYNSISYDIVPEGENIIEQDFLKLDLTTGFQIPLHFIGNPPFGRQSSIAKKFIKHICKCEKTKSFGFILPKSFKKASMQKCIPLDFHIVSEIDIQDNGFSVNGKDYDVPCIFQVWERRENNRYIEPKLEPKGYKFVKDKMKATFALRRVGVYAGKMIDMLQDGINFTGLSDQSHYYIAFNEKMTYTERDTFREKYYEIVDFKHNNTVGPKSIGKQEFIKELNKLF
tara:strand:+ start:1227 stop:2072 length:846 start_codon:yes stop_codon:yes gene_type:complete